MRSVSVSLKPLLLATVIGGAAVASADVYVMNFDTLVTGFDPNGTNIATLTISDLGAGSVQFQLDHNATSAAGQFLTNIWFNLSPFQVPTISGQTPSDSFMGGFIASENGINNAGLAFDLNQMFETSGSGNRVLPGDSVTWVLTGDANLDAADFISNAVGDPDNVIAMIHIQGIDGVNSGKLAATELAPPVPEPASMAALGLGVLALARRRKARKV